MFGFALITARVMSSHHFKQWMVEREGIVRKSKAGKVIESRSGSDGMNTTTNKEKEEEALGTKKRTAGQ